MTIFGTKDLGLDEDSGLQKQVQFWNIDINGKTEVVTVKYDIVLLAPKGQVVKILETNQYRRFNRPDILDDEGNVILPANMKWDQLKESATGKGILEMIDLDVKNYPDLKQN